jgi:hypothetical protein
MRDCGSWAVRASSGNTTAITEVPYVWPSTTQRWAIKEGLLEDEKTRGDEDDLFKALASASGTWQDQHFTS